MVESPVQGPGYCVTLAESWALDKVHFYDITPTPYTATATARLAMIGTSTAGNMTPTVLPLTAVLALVVA